MPRRNKSRPDWTFINTARQNGFTRICGVDEAGRGPLAGPVVCAAVTFATASQSVQDLNGLNDSKRLSQVQRERVLNMIRKQSDIFVTVVEPAEIDQRNILWATMAGMARAIAGLRADFAHIDGNRLPPDMPCEAEAIVKGDGRCVQIAAASIVAKVTRDRLMIEADRRFPDYGFAQHKGYPTRAHLEALERFGPSPIHRRSFGPVREAYRLF